ncbi:MAG: DUF1830 domain-containing protein [Leptolyngbya sp. SIO1E4]|nr:DUF1830 domain-containing protein [Leptolyngbya sp. SIO1E4]
MTSLKPPHKILCQYNNHTSQFQIIRISNISHWFFERTIIPKGSVLFETFQDAQLEIHTSQIMGSILSDIIPCNQLIRIFDKPFEQSQLIKKSA